jgi:hypothetical protein
MRRFTIQSIRSFVGRPDGKRPLGRKKRRWKGTHILWLVLTGLNPLLKKLMATPMTAHTDILKFIDWGND